MQNEVQALTDCERLTDRQRRFAAEYAKDPDPTQAAIRAGYRAKTARTTALRLLRSPTVRAASDPSPQALSEEVLRRLRRIAFADEDGTYKLQEQLRAMELLMKHLNSVSDRQDTAQQRVTVVLEPPLEAWAE